MANRALAKKMAQTQSERRSRWWRLGLIYSALTLLLTATALVLTDQMFNPDAFRIKQLKITGRFINLSPETVEEVVLRNQSGNFFSVDLDSIREQVESMRWVDRATVRRQWPDALLVHVVEHKPVMRLNESAWVNIRGGVVDLPEYTAQAPTVKLIGAPEHAKEMMVRALKWSKQFDVQGLLVREVVLSQTGAWSLRLRYRDDIDSSADEFVVMLGDVEVEERLTRFSLLFNRRFRFSRERLVTVDTRYPDGVAVTTSSPDADSNEAHEDARALLFEGGLSRLHRGDAVRFITTAT